MKLVRRRRGLWAAAGPHCRAAHLLAVSLIALADLLAAGSAAAQGTGVLTGRIVDASTQKPLADVVVTATSPALHSAEVVVSDAGGVYRIPNLPPGEYSLQLDRATYPSSSRGGISIRSESTLQVNAELSTERTALGAESIARRAPTVDVGSSSTGISLSQDFMSHLPLGSGTASRSLEELAIMAPGARTDRYGVSINGTTSLENSFTIDGINVGANNPAFGTLRTLLSVEFVKELTVRSGGSMPGDGRSMGGRYDVVTQSGSNEFHGSVFFNLTPGALEGPRTPVLRDGTTISTTPGLGSLRDFGATLGGPILKDRLWFFGGVQAAFTRNTLTRKVSELELDPMTGEPVIDPATGFIKTREIKEATKTYYADDRTIQYMGKLTFLLNQDHTISASVFGAPTTSGGNGTFPSSVPPSVIGPYSASAAYDIENSNDISVKYSGAFNNKRQLIDLTFGWHHQRSATLPNGESEVGEKGGFGQYINSYQGRLVGTTLFRLAGHHVVKAGVETQFLTSKNISTVPRGVIYHENDDGSIDTARPDKTTVLTGTTIVGGFLQDSWQLLDKVTLNFGLRYDTQILYGPDGEVGLSLPNQWSPRVGVIYDFTQQGRSKLFASFARYHEGVPLDLAGKAQAGSRDPSTDGSPQGCDPRTNGTSGEACRPTERAGSEKAPVDPDIRAPSSDELVLGAEYEIFSNARLGLTFTHSHLNNAVEDMSNDEANTYFIGNPGYGIAKDFPKATRSYNAVSLAFQKALTNTWLAGGSYTLSFLRGNYADLFRLNTSPLEPDIHADFDLRSLLSNRDGALPADQTHQIKLFGAKDFPLPGDMVITTGLTFRTQSGSPLNYYGSHPLYRASEAFILPRGSAGRGDWIHTFDARLGYGIRLAKQSQLTFSADIFNLFNFQGATARDQIYTTQAVLPVDGGTSDDLPTKTGAGKVKKADGSLLKESELNPNFGKPTAFQEPRQFRFGAKVTF